MLWTIFAILIVFSLLGFGFHVGGGFTYLLLLAALIVLLVNVMTGRAMT